MMISLARFGLISAFAMAALPTSAANFVSGSTFNVKVLASSTGAPCEFDCWERWQETTGLGFVMVEKDSAGNIVAAGRFSDPYFQDLWASTDEILRKNFSAPNQVLRYGTVRTVVEGCAVSCVFTVDFGYAKDVVLGLNSVGKIGGVHAIDDAVLIPAGPGDAPEGTTQCTNNAISSPNCVHYAGGGYFLGTGVTIWIQYDEFGNVVAVIIKSMYGEYTIEIT